MKKLLKAYGMNSPLSELDVQHWAKFDVVVTGFEMAADVAKVKALNPNVKIVGYLNSVLTNPSHEFYYSLPGSVFIRDLNGNLLSRSWDANNVVDPSNVDWQNFYANYVNQKCSQYGFDGVFVDDCWGQWTQWFNTIWGVDPILVPDESNWHNKMLSFLNSVRSKTSGKLMLINNMDSDDYISVVDGFFLEDFLIPDYAVIHVQQFLKVRPQTKFCHSKTNVDRMFSFCAANLMDNVAWGYAGGYYYPNDPDQGYPAEMDINLGNPISNYTIEGNIYKRLFEHARIEIDFNSRTGTIILQEEAPVISAPGTLTVTLQLVSTTVNLNEQFGLGVSWSPPDPNCECTITWGDGATVTLQQLNGGFNVYHVYSSPGSFMISVYVVSVETGAFGQRGIGISVPEPYEPWPSPPPQPPVQPPVSGPCFIATAAYGTPLHKDLDVLRRFRDDCLPDRIVKAYYACSPPIAKLISKHDNLKKFVRVWIKLFLKLYK